MTKMLEHKQNKYSVSREWTRRHFLRQAGLGTVGLALGLTSDPRPAHAANAAAGRPDVGLLESSPFVYISPIKSNGTESTCHAELWYAWIDNSIIVTVAADRWKAKALGQGLNKARIWVGAHGRWKAMLGSHNENFRKAPNFFADAEQVTKDAKDKAGADMIDRMLMAYDKKYPTEIERWRDAMRSGNADGSRIMIRYRPRANNQ